jgi:fatty acid desaturase
MLHARGAADVDEDTFGGRAALKLPLDQEGADAISRLARWMRIVGTIQIAIAGMCLLLFTLLTLVGGAMLGGGVGMLLALIPIIGFGVWLLQGLRTQAAGEQLKNLAEAHDIDYLELAFSRLRVVFIIDIIVAVLRCANGSF